MRMRDLFMLVTSILTMIAGAFVPQWADTLAPLPRLCMMTQLYLAFLAVNNSVLFGQFLTRPQTIVRMIVARLFLMPITVFAIFRIFCPDFALAALLIAAGPIGVMSTVYGLMLKTDVALILVATIGTSLLLPLSLPFFLLCMQEGLELLHFAPLNLPESLSLGDMSLSLCITILIPFVLACATRLQPSLAETIRRFTYHISLVAIWIANVAILSQYAEILYQTPSLIVTAMGSACAHSLILSSITIFTTRHRCPDERVSCMICAGAGNNILMMIVSMEFFGVNEALMAAAYLLPQYAMLLYYRFFAQRWGVGIEQTA